ncbi:MAG: METTL5 family protein [Candidatus Bathyarchaeia archaeon]
MDGLEVLAPVDSPRISVRKRDLEIVLQGIAPYANPKVDLEQYTTPADIAADLLFRACYTYGDINGKTIIDLGTGTGRLAIGAAILEAKSVVGIDVDSESLYAASANSRRMRLDVNWVVGDIESIRNLFDTVVMNPPFGTKQEHADIRFLRVALDIGKVIYSIHKSTTQSFISQWLKDHDVEFEIVMATKMTIGHQFDFHRKQRYFVAVNILRIMHS